MRTSCARAERSLEDVLLGEDGLRAVVEGVLLEGGAALEGLAPRCLGIENRLLDVDVAIEGDGS